MKEYVVGFLFSQFRTHVALIEKQRPIWQHGKLNGLGGKVEIGERPDQAMRREFMEEAGADVIRWRKFCHLKHDGSVIHFYMADGDYEIDSMTDERVDWYRVKDLRFLKTMPNLQWLVPMAADKDGVTASVLDTTKVPA